MGGVKVIEHRWSGKYSDIPQARLELDNTMAKALRIAGEHNRVMTIMHSAGNWVGERLFSRDLEPLINEAFKENRIDLMSLGSPSRYNFGQLDRNWKNFWARWDLISRVSEVTSPNIYDIKYNYYPDITRDIGEAHFIYKDPRFISNVIHQTFPSLSMPQLDKMIMQQNVSSWRYFPSRGDWPGVYNFQSIAPPNYYLQQQPIVPQLPNVINQQPTVPSFNQPTYTAPQPVYIPQPIYTPKPIYTPPPVYTPPVYKPPKQPQIIMPKVPVYTPPPIRRR